ncbi:hypothetical protein HK099_003608 [Clydaea vesicula]|uniref:Uncharacterized protein n=1 Tax=Clydaea vesicula TaxID=447962 RepID=A0AAD5U4N9_9FUNG|nr:hypothetical protein HK099_003608 [Clydaea vesicula]
MAILEMNSTTKLIKANQEIKVIHQLWSPSNFGSTSTVNGSTFLNEFEYNITHLPIISIQDTKNMKTTLTLSTKEKDIQRITRLSSHITEKQIYKLDNAADIDTCWSETFCLSKPVKYKIAKNITSNKRIFENNGEISDLNENSTSNNKKDKIKTDSMILLVSAKIEPNVDASTNHFEVQHFLNFDIEFETDSIHPNQIAKNKFYSIFKFSHNASRDQLIHNPSTLLTSDSSDDEITKNYNNRSSKSKPFDDCNIAQQKDIRYKLQKVSISIPIVIVGKIENF